MPQDPLGGKRSCGCGAAAQLNDAFEARLRVKVEKPRMLAPDLESMHGSPRNEDKRALRCDSSNVACQKLDLTVEHVEHLVGIEMHMRWHTQSMGAQFFE